MVYGLALQDRWPSLPPNLLTVAHPEIDLPPGNDRQLMVEPYIHTARSVLSPPSFSMCSFFPVLSLPPPPSAFNQVVTAFMWCCQVRCSLSMVSVSQWSHVVHP